MKSHGETRVHESKRAISGALHPHSIIHRGCARDSGTDLDCEALLFKHRGPARRFADKKRIKKSKNGNEVRIMETKTEKTD